MIQFKVYRHPSGEVKAVKQGWSWPAFLFGFFWAMAVKMWALGFGLLIASVILGVSVTASDPSDEAQVLVNIASVIANFVLGINGNVWREKDLISRGFELEDTVTAANRDGAIALFLKGAAMRA